MARLAPLSLRPSGAFLPLLTDLLNFVKRVTDVGKNLVLQLACLYHERQRLYLTTFKQVQLESVYQNLVRLSGVSCFAFRAKEQISLVIS